MSPRRAGFTPPCTSDQPPGRRRLSGFYARGAQGDFANTLGDSSPPRLSLAPSPLAGSPRDSAKPPSDPPFPLSPPFLRRNKPALRQKVQGKQDSVLGAIRRHCCQTRPGAAHELTAANALSKSTFKTAALCGKSVIHS